MNLPKFKIGNLEINLIQGGMGVGISMRNLASAVADHGGAGIIASVGLGLLKGYPGSYAKANQDALRDEIRATRQRSNGVIGVNIMRALSDYPTLVETAVEENVDLIISGAGLARDLPSHLKDKDIKLIPIVSSGIATKIMCKSWARQGHIPDAIIVEGPLAGGHLGFRDINQLNNLDYTNNALEDIVKEVLEESKKYCEIPIIAAGGIYTGADIKKAISWGASGVQIGTRFVTTNECDADDKFKQESLRATKEDIVIIKSPVGLPGRVIKNEFLEKVIKGEKIDFSCYFRCLKTCNPNESPYCIAEALVEAQKGNLKKGFAFAGANAYRATPETCLDESGNFISVETLMQTLSEEYPAG